jgi:hypothetical protein
MTTETATERSLVAEFDALIESAAAIDLELMPPAGNNPWSADLMVKSPSRPAVGVQGMILDAMCDDLISTAEAVELLGKVIRRIRAEKEAAKNGR